MHKHGSHFETADGRLLAYGEFHAVSPRFSIMPYWPRWNSRYAAFKIRRDATGEIKAPPHSPPGAGCDALMMALHENYEPEGYVRYAFGHDALENVT